MNRKRISSYGTDGCLLPNMKHFVHCIGKDSFGLNGSQWRLDYGSTLMHGDGWAAKHAA